MAFDNETRNRLKSFVGDARRLLAEEFTRQLQNIHGMNPATGEIDDLSRLTHLDPSSREIAQLLRTTVEHYRATSPATTTADLLDRVVREQAFTVLNRLCALRLAEARGILIESIARGYQSKGFQLYARVANGALGDTAETYRAYLLSVFDELAVDLPVLFYRYSPQGRLFPRETALLALLELINHDDLAGLWAEDETIGWIYQYFNSVEERKKMREESSAPRNSREMAVRNQFFTPRYVVEFLTDNTLGRTWYEMRKGQTGIVDQCRYFVRRPSEIFLAEGQEPPADTEDTSNLSQEELWKRPVYTLHRDQKDPRDLKVLDPAMGSGHFLLYAFDLLETIYREAWEQNITTPSDVTGRTLREDYPDEEALRRAVPELILRHNLHGVDIDPRAVQIAGLALWLRAQKAWQTAGVRPADRPAIRKSNLVVAEPMPGEQDLLDDFLKDLKPALLGRLVRQVFDSMKLAGEAGTLLRVEDELQQEIEKARREWQALQKKTKEGHRPGIVVDMFSGAAPEQLEIELREQELMQISGERFWKDTEERVLKLLREYAEQAESGTGARRRLFADDAAKGFAFVDLCRTKFDVVVMNPPFGDASAPSKPYIDETYGDTKGDVYKAFVECFQDRLVPAGLLGIISSRTGFFLGESADWRTRVVLRLFRPLAMVDLGHGVLDAMVETAAYVLRSLSRQEEAELATELTENLHKVEFDRSGTFGLTKYAKAAGSLKRHQAAREIARLIDERVLIEVVDGGIVKYRLIGTIGVAPLRRRRRFPEMVAFRITGTIEKDTTLLEALTSSRSGMAFVAHPESFLQLIGSPFAYWVSPALLGLSKRFATLSDSGLVATKGLATTDDFRFLRNWWEVPEKSRSNVWPAFFKGGPFAEYFNDLNLVINWAEDGAELKAFLDHKIGRAGQWSRWINATDFYGKPGVCWTNRTTKALSVRPLPEGCIFAHKGPAVFGARDRLLPLMAVMNSNVFRSLVALRLGAAEAAAKSYEVGIIQSIPIPERALDDVHLADTVLSAFTGGWIVASTNESCRYFLSTRASEVGNGTAADYSRALCELLEVHYGLVEGVSSPIDSCQSDEVPGYPADQDEEEEDQTSCDGPSAQVSWMVGLTSGRWNIRYATGEKEPPPLPDPFDPLPVCPPGMLQRPDGLPVENPEELPEGYPIDIPWDGILVDDPGHGRDIFALLKRVFEVIWGEAADDRMREAAELLGQKDGDLRPWLRKDFFPFHLKRYSKSRRKAPIYWPLSTPSGAYTLWIYYHRLTDQTLLTAVNDFVEPKIEQVEGDIAKLRQNTDRTKKQEQELASLTDLEHELRDFREELLCIAKFWKPNLNDGVQITAAPLWKLFQHRPWQTVLKDTWKKLEKGDYDWAHLAYSIWPDRVREKCKTDKSLAIAHGLEDVYVEPPASAKKGKGRKKKVEVEVQTEEEADE